MQSKESAVKRFKDACGNPKNDGHRKTSVATQFYRHAWEIDDECGRIRIDKRPLQIQVFNIAESSLANFVPGGFKRIISESEYEELRTLFFGKYEPNVNYLRSIGSSVN